MAKKIKTNHAFTKKQLEALNKELQKISPNQIKGLKGVNIKAKKDFTEIKVLKSAYLLDVFLSFLDITDADYPKYRMYKISSSGEVNYEAKKSLEFNNFSDRISFFNELEEIKFHY